MQDQSRNRDKRQPSEQVETYALEGRDEPAPAISEEIPDRLQNRHEQPAGGILLHNHLHTCLSGEVWLFLLLSIADVVLTYKLLSGGGHFESNPVARFFLDSWGPKGLVYFKFAMVAFVFVVVQIIAWKRVETARWVLNFAILAVGAVVAYSSVLFLRAAE